MAHLFLQRRSFAVTRSSSIRIHIYPSMNQKMKLSSAFATLALAAPCANAFTPDDGRRAALQSIGASIASAAAITVSVPSSASASLLDEYGSDPKKIAEKKPVVEAKATPKSASTIEPNLRSNYYYPTNKKRYLPRIKKCSDAIPDAAAFIGNEDWDSATEFAVKIADDTVLPMKLYTSSLSGGGTNVKVSFAKNMMDDANRFEKAQKALVKALAKKDQQASSRALEDLSEALLSYRTEGKLLGPDGGGDIPSVDEIRRSACRVQGRTFEKKVKDRDARLAQAAPS